MKSVIRESHFSSLEKLFRVLPKKPFLFLLHVAVALFVAKTLQKNRQICFFFSGSVPSLFKG